MTAPETPETPFHDLDHYVAHPRVGGLTMSPDGTRLATIVTTLDAKRTRYVNAVWEIDPAGSRPARRVTRSSKGESGAAYDANGDLYFISARPDPDAESDDTVPALWVIPAEGGEARVAVSRPGGVSAVHVAPRPGGEASGVFVTAERLPGAEASDDPEKADAELRKQRKDLKVSALLHTTSTIRYWDHDLGPDEPHLFAVEAGDTSARNADSRPSTTAGQGDEGERTPAEANPSSASAESLDAAAEGVLPEEPPVDPTLPTTVDARPPVVLRHLTKGIGAGLRMAGVYVAPDGSFLLTGRTEPAARGERREYIVRVDVASGEWRDLMPSDDEYSWDPGPVSPDGRRAVVLRHTYGTPASAPDTKLAILDLETEAATVIAEDWDRWPHPFAWFPDGESFLVQADQDGRGPLFRVDATTGEVTQLTHDDATWSDAAIHPDGTAIFGVRASYEYPAEVVRLDVGTGEVTRLPNPVERPKLPGTLAEVETTTDDGVRVRGWLALPHGTSADQKAPLALWIHGGPLNSWNAWSWRWNPWNMVARGYAVLLPDPALSTGYGRDFIQRGWGTWGDKPYTDLMAITDAVEARPDIDARRTVAMGGSFGGYMANWIAGHTDRFTAIVTHASLWALDQFGPTTDAAFFWRREMSPEMMAKHSPHLSVENIRTPMLVVHGDKDYRVPIGEGLRLWWELLTKSHLAADDKGESPHRFLYFPDENHWVLTPQHAKVWYEVVMGFVDEHVREVKAELPKVLGRG